MLKQEVNTADPARPFMPDDDMNDRAEIAHCETLPELRRLLRALSFCDDVLAPVFRATDAAAIAAQKTYLRFAGAAAYSGVMAVLLGIVQLSRLGQEHLRLWLPHLGEWLLPIVELLFASAAVAVALAGLAGHKQQNWFLLRYRAERLRLLKFKILTDAHLWSEDAAIAQMHLLDSQAEIEIITASTYPALQNWISEGTTPEVLAAPEMTAPEWREFRSYYQRTRLEKQIHYFLARHKRYLERDDRTKIWPSVFFFGSIAFVLAHFCVELAFSTGGGNRIVATLALVAAAGLPSLGAVVRASRGVLEFARNASRYESTHHVLKALAVRLRSAADPAAVFREIGFCEQTLEIDLREWLRLMVESEWFG